MTALFAAIYADDFHQFQQILATEGLPPFPEDWQLLEKALLYNRYIMAQLLIDYGCHVERVRFSGSSPLHLAVNNGSPYELIESLLVQGAKVNRIDPRGDTALHLAFNISAGERVMDLLLRTHLTNSACNAVNQSGLSYLHIAASMPNVGFIECLVEQGKADINCRINADAQSLYAGYTPLHMAVEFRRFEVAELLLGYGADLYMKDVNESTPLHLALEGRNENFIELLFYYDCERINHINRFGLSHFMASCVCEDSSVARDFLDNLANGKSNLNVNEVINNSSNYPFNGYTALLIAVEYRCFDTVRLLLANGARLTPTSQGLLATIAEKHEFRDIAQLIEMHEQHYRVIDNDAIRGFEDDFKMDLS